METEAERTARGWVDCVQAQAVSSKNHRIHLHRVSWPMGASGLYWGYGGTSTERRVAAIDAKAAADSRRAAQAD